MGFNSVYRSLVEIFPEIDSRLLKAVAIEHSKDVDAAANVVLTEILPLWSEQPVTSASRSVDQSASTVVPKDQSPRDLLDEDLGAEHEELSSLSRRRRVVVTSEDMDVGSAMEGVAIASGHATETDHTCATETHHTCNPNLDSSRVLNTLNKAVNMSTGSQFYDANDGNSQSPECNESEELILLGTHESSNEVGLGKLGEKLISTNDDIRNADLSGVIDDPKSNESVSLEKCKDVNAESNKSVSLDKGEDINVKVGPEQTPSVLSTTLMPENGAVHVGLTDINVPLANVFLDGLSSPGKSSLDCSLVEGDKCQEHATDSLECGHDAESGSLTSVVACEVADACVTPRPKANQENPTNEGHIDNQSTIDAVVSRSGQVCRIDLLEEVIEDAKNNKKTLFSAMESIMNLMREVELQEKAAEEAKAEASYGGFDTLSKVDELKQMLTHAKQANDMHAGEIYGEKSILATEARELQTRLLNLSEERDKSLAVLDQMRVTLEARLAEAVDARKAAEQEKLEKEESARKLLAEQEAIMEKVVQEAKFLQQEAEENSKLRDFLMDRGQVVDSLQGEISVICQDVRLLKEKFDERVPLSQSVSSSQTTCILASSGSSMKSIASLVAEQDLASENPEKLSPSPSIHVESPRLEAERTRADRQEPVEDDWEIFDNEEAELYSSAM